MAERAAAVLAVYRRRNARRVAALIRDLPAGWTVGLWGLDGVARGLRQHTLGSGPGTKFDLLNTVYERLSPPPGADVVVADDDISFEGRGTLPLLVELVRAAGFSLAMPGHSPRSRHSFRITRAEPGSIARRTTFVEIGPLFVVSAAARQVVLPFPEGVGMGWGLELTWYELAQQGHLLGVVDGCPIRHRGPVARAYDDAPERVRLASAFAERGLNGWEDVQHELETWHTGESLPPWLDD